MSLIEVVITSHLSSTDRLVARRIDSTARWFFPVLFALSFGYRSYCEAGMVSEGATLRQPDWREPASITMVYWWAINYYIK